MAEYRKKPVVINAWKLSHLRNIAAMQGPDGLPPAVATAYLAGDILFTVTDDGEHIVRVRTLEGPMTARLIDYLIQGVQFEFYTCREDIFEATYEPAV